MRVSVSIIIFVVLSCLVMAAHAGKKYRVNNSATMARPGEFPHQVSIQFPNHYHWCGGALITRAHVLTAAHCVYQLVTGIPNNSKDAGTVLPAANTMTVEVGSNVIGRGWIYRVKRMSFHRHYDPKNTRVFPPNDVAIVTLSQPIVESAYVKVIALPQPMSELPVGTVVTLSGFTSNILPGGGGVSDYLQKLTARVVSEQDCSYYLLNHPSSRRSVIPSHLCANGGWGYGACAGDSGGPLIHNNVIVGIVSGGTDECGDGYPDVYGKVSHYIDYIRYEIGYDRATYEYYCSNFYNKNYYYKDYCNGQAVAIDL